MSRSLLWLCCLIVTGTHALIPDDYIMKIIPYCGTSPEDDPYILVVTDLQARVRAVCGNGRFEFNNTDTVNFYLPMSYKGRDSGLCEFVKRANSHIYVVKVIFSYGELGQLMTSDDQEKTVTCTFDPSKTQESGSQKVVNTLVAPEEVLVRMGTEMVNVSLALYLTDVLGRNITGQDIHLGRWVQLKATGPGGVGIRGIRPLSCDAVGENTGYKYPIFRAGCGDGIVFNRTSGFNVTGLITKSPYFPVFRVGGDTHFSFTCNVTLCKRFCDGNTCPPSRQRRHVGESQGELYQDRPYITSLSTPTVHSTGHSWSVPRTV